MNFHDWYEGIYPELTAQGLWLRGEEINTLPVQEYEQRAFRALFVRLSTYFDTGYSFTHQILYQIAANTPDVFPDLAYLPPRSDVAHFSKAGVPWLLGTKTKKGPEAFDLIGFSNSIVQELINVPHFLRRSGIPLKKSERLLREDLPLLILGGANALYSSAIWMDDPLIDGVFVGESDQAFRNILEICRDGKKNSKSKSEILSELESIPGFFQPENQRETKKSFIPNLNQSEALEAGPVYYIEDQLGNSHLQISEGCPCFCSFCAESWDRKPYRERKADQLREVALRAKASMGLERIDIYSFNFNMHSGLYQVLWDLVPHFRGIGLKSQRFDLLAHDPQMVEFQHAIEKASLTCGLEGISPRLRKYLHKNLEPEQLHQSLAAIFKSKARELKVFLIATGLEEEQDFAALDDLLDHLKSIRSKHHSGTRIILSMTPLVRFPWTPLEFENAYPVGHYQSIISKAAGRVRAAGLEFRESADLPEYWVSQILVRADRPEVSRALLGAVDKTDYIYYRDVPDRFMQALNSALLGEGVDPVESLKGYDLEESRKKPWAKIQTGVRREFLWDEVLRARSFVEIDYCLGRSWSKAKCFHCGGCPTRYHVRDIVLAQQKRTYSLEQFKNRLKEARESEVELHFSMQVEKLGRGVPRKMVGVALARALMLTEPGLRVFYRGYRKSYWSRDEKPSWITGEDCITLVWHKDAVKTLESMLSDLAILSQVNQRLGGWAKLQGMTTADWKPVRVEMSSPFPLKPERYLQSRGLKHTLRRNEDGSYAYELVSQSQKKGFVAKLVRRQSETGGVACSIEVGPKFDLREFVLEAFVLSKPSDHVRILSKSFGPTERTAH
ncbi:MAG: radical SAM protein [Bdellovibrionota bacterium]